MPLPQLDINAGNLHRLDMLEGVACSALSHPATSPPLKELQRYLDQFSVRVSMITNQRHANPELYDAFRSLNGVYKNIEELRNVVDSVCMSTNREVMEVSKKVSTVPFRILTVGYRGVFIGEPEDILAHWNGKLRKPQYDVKGFAAQIAKVFFLDQ